MESRLKKGRIYFFEELNLTFCENQGDLNFVFCDRLCCLLAIKEGDMTYGSQTT